jgi:hypothetical protein
MPARQPSRAVGKGAGDDRVALRMDRGAVGAQLEEEEAARHGGAGDGEEGEHQQRMGERKAGESQHRVAWLRRPSGHVRYRVATAAEGG